MKLVVKKYYDELYKYNWVLIIGSREDARKYLLKELGSPLEISESTLGKTFGIENYGSFIWMETLKKNPSDISVFNHELIHGMLFLFDTRGISFDVNFSEHFTYYTELITKKLLSKLWK